MFLNKILQGKELPSKNRSQRFQESLVILRCRCCLIMIWYILEVAGFRAAMSVFAESWRGTKEQCRGNRLLVLIGKADLGRDEVFSSSDLLTCSQVSWPDPLRVPNVMSGVA